MVKDRRHRFYDVASSGEDNVESMEDSRDSKFLALQNSGSDRQVYNLQAREALGLQRVSYNAARSERDFTALCRRRCNGYATQPTASEIFTHM